MQARPEDHQWDGQGQSAAGVWEASWGHTRKEDDAISLQVSRPPQRCRFSAPPVPTVQVATVEEFYFRTKGMYNICFHKGGYISLEAIAALFKADSILQVHNTMFRIHTDRTPREVNADGKKFNAKLRGLKKNSQSLISFIQSQELSTHTWMNATAARLAPIIVPSLPYLAVLSGFGPYGDAKFQEIFKSLKFADNSKPRLLRMTQSVGGRNSPLGIDIDLVLLAY